MKRRTYISFDRAIKKLLRKKANFETLEGFLSEFLGSNDKFIQDLTGLSIVEIEDLRKEV